MRFSQYLRLHPAVTDSNRDIIRKASRKVLADRRYSRRYRDVRHRMYRGLIEIHERAQRLGYVCLTGADMRD